MNMAFFTTLIRMGRIDCRPVVLWIKLATFPLYKGIILAIFHLVGNLLDCKDRFRICQMDGTMDFLVSLRM